jgi:hypothetical protein
MRIDSSGNVGIGTASPASFGAGSQGLTINGTGNFQNISWNVNGTSVATAYTNGTSGFLLGTENSSPLQFQTAGVERMRIDSSGNLLLGSTSATGTGALRGSYGTGGITTNFAAGDGALNANTTGSQNVAVGVSALISNTTGTANLAVGYQALGSNVSGSNNLAMGQTALYYNTASNNTAVGYQAMQGASGTSTGGSNAALGVSALAANTSGNSNAAVGTGALQANTIGEANSGFGASAASAITTGNYNTAVGYGTATLLTTGSFNQVFGDSITLAAAATGRIAIGRNFTQGVNTSVIIGNGTNRISNSYTVNATWAFSSDERIKNVIGKDTLGLDFINDLEPVTFRWKPSNEVPKELTSRYAEENVQDTDLVMHGLIAQNVKAALDKAGVDTFTGWSEDEDGTQKLGITDLITPMINAINELTARVKQLEGK